MKVVIAGGSGHVGAVLVRHFAGTHHAGQEHDVVVLSRSVKESHENYRVGHWDGKTLGSWCQELEGTDVVINLAGRTVNCRYNAKNLKEMMDSRVDSTKIIGEAIAACVDPPKVWLQASTATIYAHRFDAANDELTGIMGGDEPNAPFKWVASINIAKAWEQALEDAVTPQTRKVALRSAMTMSADSGSIFDVMSGLARKGLGGLWSDGRQYISWIHEDDFVRAIDFLIERGDLSGPVNLSSPFPLPQREFIKILRETVGAKLGIPATRWMLEIGTWLMQTETELVLKSRRVIPTRLLEAGFQFKYPKWEDAANELHSRLRR